MRFKKYAEYSQGLKPVTTAALINILFLVFIFGGLCMVYMATGSGISVQVPRAITSESVPKSAAQIIVAADGSMRLNGQKVSIEDLQLFLKQISGRSQTLIINADSRAPWEYVIKVWDIVRSSGQVDCVAATHP